jgi:hypothetical protein
LDILGNTIFVTKDKTDGYESKNWNGLYIIRYEFDNDLAMTFRLISHVFGFMRAKLEFWRHCFSVLILRAEFRWQWLLSRWRSITPVSVQFIWTAL